MKGFFDYEDGVFKGKGISAINKSRRIRSDLISLFRGSENLPSSIMRADRKQVKEEEDEHVAERGYNQTMLGADKVKDLSIPAPIREAWTSSGKGVANGALSRFPQNIGRTVINFYSDPGEVVFDPFAGHNSRMELCIRAGRHYLGSDVSQAFMKSNKARAEKLRKEFPAARIKLVCGDSCKVPFKSNHAHFTLTSPPYWDSEYYGDEAEQLGKCPSYEEFLKNLSLVLAENLRVLRPGRFAIWFVNDIKRNKKMLFYHADLLRLGEQVGFTPHDIMIVDLGRSIRDVFLAEAVRCKVLPKRHEYGIVFQKPPQGKTK